MHASALAIFQLTPDATSLNATGALPPSLPHACDAWNARGLDAFTRHDWQAAAEDFGNAIALGYQYHHFIHFDCSALHTERARLHLAAGNTEQAQTDIKEAIFQDHNNPLKDWKEGERVPDYHEADPLEEDWQRHIALPRHTGHLEARCFHPEISHYRELHRTARAAQTFAAYDTAIAAATAFHRHYHRHAAQHHLNRGLAYFRLATCRTETTMRGQETERAISPRSGSPCETQEAFHGATKKLQETSPALSACEASSPCDLQEANHAASEQLLTLALNDFSKACDLDKGWAIAWRCRGDTRTALGSTRNAEADYARAAACA